MRIESVTLKGILRFTTAATLDLVDAGPGLVAVVGANGEGKTGTLEAAIACLYRVFPSRSDRELVDYATGPDSYIETTFALDGQGCYRARLNLDAVHRKADAVLSRVNPDGSTTVLTDGKVTSYDAAIAQLLPPLPALLASVFSAQNRAGSFITLDKKGRKELFASLLGLGVYDTMAERAKTAAGLVQQAIDKLEARREVLLREANEAASQALDREVTACAAAARHIDERRTTLQAELTTIETALAERQDAAAAYATARAHLDRVEVELESTTRDLGLAHAALDRHVRESADEAAALTARHDAGLASLDLHLQSTRERDDLLAMVDQRLAKDLADLDARIAKNRDLAGRADEIRAAVATLERMDGAIREVREDERRHTERLDADTQRLTAVIAQQGALERQETALHRARHDAALLTAVPCGGTEAFAGCQFLTAAAAAKTSIAPLEAAVAPRAAVDEERAHLAETLEQLHADRARLRHHLETLDRNRSGVAAIAARVTDLNAAEERIAAHQARKVDLTTDADRRRADLRAAHDARIRDLQQRRADAIRTATAERNAQALRSRTRLVELQSRADAIAARQTLLTDERDVLRARVRETQTASDEAAAWTTRLTEGRRAWDETTAALARVTALHEELQRRVRILSDRCVELRRLDGHLGAQRQDLADWQLLAKALGRDGLPTLEIDAAGPTVSAFCNDLLQTCFGSRFSVELVTQEAKTTKSRDGSAFKEVFELRVFDSARGGDARDLADLSGGEQVLVDEALKSAIALLVNQKNAHPMRTAWRDETTGALDGDNAARYVDMLRRVQQLGGFHQVLFVSHNPDAARQADVLVRVGGGRIEILNPPFSEAA